MTVTASPPGSLLFSRQQIAGRAAVLAKELGGFFVLGILYGCVPFLDALLAAGMRTQGIRYIRCRRYKGFRPKKQPVIRGCGFSPRDFERRNILIVEDIIDQGVTLASIHAWLKRFNPTSITNVALLSRNVVLPPATRIGFLLPADAGFVVGYGMDFLGLYRDLPEIYSLLNERGEKK